MNTPKRSIACASIFPGVRGRIRTRRKRRSTAEQRAALERAIETVTRFHELQSLAPLRLETAPGVVCERMTVPLDAVGLYVPAGTAPLPSTALMLAVPARIAGCPLRVMCTPPRPDGTADPAVLVAARLCGITQVFKLGGAQAVAAMAYGTASVPKVVKIFGPGNSWVTAAKQLVAQDADGAAFDMPAGPSEVLVVADETRATGVRGGRPAGAGRTQPGRAGRARDDLARAGRSLRRGSGASTGHVAAARDCRPDPSPKAACIVVRDLATAIDVSNRYAPEHLILQVAEPRALLAQVRNAGSVFLGAWTPETMGDYCSGTNHVLPTYGHARAYSGLGVPDFVKRITVQELSAEGLARLGPTARTLARLESLDAHANAVHRPPRCARRGSVQHDAVPCSTWPDPTSCNCSPTSTRPGIPRSSACTRTKCPGAPRATTRARA